MEDGYLEAIGVPVNVYAGYCDMMGRGKGVKVRYNEFSNPRSCVEAGGQASENGCVKGVIEDQLQMKLGYEVGDVRLPLLPLGGRRGETLGGPEDCLQL